MDKRIIVLVTTILEGKFHGTKVHYMNECPDEAKENPVLFFTEMYEDKLRGRSHAQMFVTVIKLADINNLFLEAQSDCEKSTIEKDVERYIKKVERRKEYERIREIETLKELATKYPEVLKVCVEQ